MSIPHFPWWFDLIEFYAFRSAMLVLFLVMLFRFMKQKLKG